MKYREKNDESEIRTPDLEFMTHSFYELTSSIKKNLKN